MRDYLEYGRAAEAHERAQVQLHVDAQAGRDRNNEYRFSVLEARITALEKKIKYSTNSKRSS